MSASKKFSTTVNCASPPAPVTRVINFAVVLEILRQVHGGHATLAELARDSVAGGEGGEGGGETIAGGTHSANMRCGTSERNKRQPILPSRRCFVSWTLYTGSRGRHLVGEVAGVAAAYAIGSR